MGYGRRECLTAVIGALFLSPVLGDHLEFTENFLEDPCASEAWVCQGSTLWAPPPDLAIECEDPDAIDPDNPCTLYPNEPNPQEFGGYVMLTGTGPQQSGNLFTAESGDWNNVKITAIVELRDGDLDNPGHGISVVFLGEEEEEHHEEEGGEPHEEGEEGEPHEEEHHGPPEAVGGTGEGLGATGLGARPTIILTFSNQGAGLAFSHEGFEGDSIPLNVGPIPIEEAFPVNNGAPHLAAANRWQIEIRLHDCHVEMSVENKDAGYPQTTVIDHQIEDPEFKPLHGFLAVTAATGATGQNHLVHFLKSEEIPPLQDLECPQEHEEEPLFIRGEANGDGARDLSDAVFVLNHLFAGGNAPSCMKAVDSNDDSIVDLSDPVYFLRAFFGGGSALGAPSEACGADPTHDELPCEEFADCGHHDEPS